MLIRLKNLLFAKCRIFQRQRQMNKRLDIFVFSFFFNAKKKNISTSRIAK